MSAHASSATGVLRQPVPVFDPALAQAHLHALLAECATTNASDVHLVPGEPPYFRIHGNLAPRSGFPSVAPGETDAMLRLIAPPGHEVLVNERGALDGALNAPDGTRFRFNAYCRAGVLALALRKLEDRFRSLAELGLPDSLYELGDLRDGLVLVAGPTGSGKSTTLATLIDYINRTREGHIITIEDPVEYQHRSQKSLVNQRQVGTDTPDFQSALVNSLRQDPDVILVGEIREIETIRTAITAAETGHLVFSTVHAGDCVGTIERLVSVFPADEQLGIRRQLALTLRAVVTQHLLRADGPDGWGGKKPGRPGTLQSNLPLSRQSDTPVPEDTRPSRVLASEILRVTPAVANLIATEKSALIYSSMESGATLGMKTLEEDLARLWAFDLINETTATCFARNPNVVRQRREIFRSTLRSMSH